MYDNVLDPFGMETFSTEFVSINGEYHVSEENEEDEELIYRVHFDVQPNQ